MKIEKFIKQSKKLEKMIKKMRKHGMKELVGQKVTINKFYAKWLTKKVDSLFAIPGSKKIDKNEEYYFYKALPEKRNTGKILSIKYEKDSNEFTAYVEFKVGKNTFKEYFDLMHLKTVK